MNTDPPCHLNGLGVLVTRPEHQAKALCEAIESCGGKAISFPTIEIIATPHRQQQLSGSSSYDDLLFISPNAVIHSIDSIQHQNQRIIAIGDATAKLLENSGLDVSVTPDGPSDSETLLASGMLADMQGRKVLIIRGQGGRQLLGESLRERGATVDYAEVYLRRCPDIDPSTVIKRWHEVNVVTATSNNILDNLLTLCSTIRERLLVTPLIVASQRMADHAEKLGFREIHHATGASTQQLLTALCNLVVSSLEDKNDGKR